MALFGKEKAYGSIPSGGSRSWIVFEHLSADHVAREVPPNCPPTPPRENDQGVSWPDASCAGTEERLPGPETVSSPARRLHGCGDSHLTTLSSADHRRFRARTA